MAANTDQTYQSTDWEIYRTSNDSLVFSSYNDTYNESLYSIANELPVDSYYIRARHNGQDISSLWSDPLTFDYVGNVSSVDAPTLSESEPSPFPIGGVINGSTFSGNNQTHQSTDWELYKFSDNSLIDSSIGDTTNLTQFVIDNAIAADSYYIRARYNGEDITSDWSNELQFDYEGNVDYVNAPTLSTSEVTNPFPIGGVVDGSAFDASGQTHQSTDWEIRRVTDDGLVASSIGDTTDLTQYTIDEFIGGGDYYIRARYNGDSITSNWSNELQFSYDGRYKQGLVVASADAYKLDSEGNQLWYYSENPASNIPAVAIDKNDNVYSHNSSTELRKFTPGGSEIKTGNWPYTHSAYSIKVHVDANGYVYVFDGDKIRKIDSSDGTEVTTGWPVNKHLDKVTTINSDSSGNIYTTSYDDTVKKVDSSGNLQWSISFAKVSASDTAIDSTNGYVYVTYTNSSNKTEIEKLNISDGSSVGGNWPLSGFSDGYNRLDIDSVGNIYSCNKTELEKIAPDGSSIWTSFTHPAYITNVKVSKDDDIYTSENDTIYKVDINSGSSLTDKNFPVAFGYNVEDMDVRKQ